MYHLPFINYEQESKQGSNQIKRKCNTMNNFHKTKTQGDPDKINSPHN